MRDIFMSDHYQARHGRLYAPDYGLSFVVPGRGSGSWSCVADFEHELRFFAADSPIKGGALLRDDATDSDTLAWVSADLLHAGEQLNAVTEPDAGGGDYQSMFAGNGDALVGIRRGRCGPGGRGFLFECTTAPEGVDDMLDLCADLHDSLWFMLKVGERPESLRPHHCLAFLFWACVGVDQELAEAELLKVGDRLTTWWDPPSNESLVSTLRETLLWWRACAESVDLLFGEMNLAVDELTSLSGFGAEQRRAFVEDIAQVALADGAVNDGEKRFIRMIANAFDVPL